MHTLVLVRHGESTWNKENVFTGWTDVDLSDKGKEQAREAGKLLTERGFIFDVTYTSYLKRAIRTLWMILDEMDMMWVPQFKSWRLNERHYGALQGLNKSQTATEFGEDQVKLWRRGYAIQPPALELTDTRHAKHQPHYRHIEEYAIPHTESLKDTFDRLMPYFVDTIAPSIKSGNTVLIVAHGNTLRALIKHLDNLTEDEVLELNIPVGEPLVYELDDSLKPHRHYYLNSDEKIAQEVQAVKDQARAA